MNTTGSPKVGGTLQEPRRSEGLDDIDGQINVQQSTPGSFKTGTGRQSSILLKGKKDPDIKKELKYCYMRYRATSMN